MFYSTNIMARRKKRKYTENITVISKKAKQDTDNSINSEFINSIHRLRLACGSSIKNFKFNKRRVRVLSLSSDIPENSNGILYWMSRDQRVQDNWAFLYAQYLALKVECPLHVCFCLVPHFLNATIRQYWFLLKGLQEVEIECKDLNISFHLLLGEASTVLPKFVSENNIGGIVADFSPLQISLQWLDDVKNNLPAHIPFCQVDAHNIIPCWETSNKQEYSARTIRKKIHNKLSEFLTDFPPIIHHPYSFKIKIQDIDWKAAESTLQIDRTVKAVDWAVPGTTAGLNMLNEFCQQRLQLFAVDRNNPNKNSLSKLSPWFHFGQISVQRSILIVNQYNEKYKDAVAVFIEEAVVRRELADNYCFFNSNYNKIDGAAEWAQTTLKKHLKDKREYIYTRDDLEQSQTHDPLWNAAQIQMVQEGKMHGFLRMYWAKKILEWTKSPEEALSFAIYLNDKYELDGRDPNGYVGCMWSICGVHDQGWPERPIFGKIRYMNYEGCKRKFDVNSFIQKYSK